MDGLNLGKAFFNFALNSEGAVRGLADFSGKVAGTMGKVVPQIKGAETGFSKFGDTMGGLIRTTDRWTRGLRGISPEVASARENIYRLQDGQKKLADTIEITKLRLNEKKQAELANIESGKRHQETADKEGQAISALNQSLADAKVKLLDLKNSTILHDQAVTEQTNAYKSADVELEIHQQKTSQLQAKIMALGESGKNYNLDLQEQAQRSSLASSKAAELTLSIVNQKNALEGLILKQKGALTEENSLSAQTDRLKESSELFVAQARNADLEFQKMKERNISAEYKKAEVALKELIIDQKQAAITAGQEAQALSLLAKQGKQGTAEYRDQQLVAQAAYQRNQALILQSAVMEGKVKQLGLEQKNYSIILKEQEKERDLLAAKAVEEDAKYQNNINRIEQLKHEHQGLDDVIKERVAEIEVLVNKEQLAITTAQQEVVAYNALEQKQQDSVHTIALRAAELDKMKLKEQSLIADWNREKEALDALKATTGASTKDIQNQEAAIAAITKQMAAHERAQDSANRKAQEATDRQSRLNLETRGTENELKRLAEAEHRQSAEMDAAKARETAAIDRAEKRKQKIEAVKQKVVEATSSESAFGKMISWVTGLFGGGEKSIESFTQSESKLNTITETVNQRLFSMGSVLRDVVVGGLGNLLGNVLTNLSGGFRMMVSSGLDSYKSFETLGMSLKALSARELVASGAFKSLTDAQAAAGVMGEQTIQWMQKLAIQSPFGIDDISGAYRLGEALGFTSSQTKRLIQDSVDWASATGATGEQITSVTRALGQMHNTGHVTLQDVNQLTDAGLSARDVLRQEFAPEILKSKKSLEDLISAGVLPADRAISAMAGSMEHDFKNGAINAGASMTGLINSIGDLKNTALREFFSSTFQTVQPLLSKLVDTLTNGATIDMLRQFGTVLGSGIGNTLNWIATNVVPSVISAFQNFVPRVVEAFTFISLLAQQAYQWGYGIGEQLAAGLSATIDMIVSTINWIGEQISYWMEPHSPPKFLPQIAVWGQQTAEVYLKGWGDADFSLLNSMSSQVKSMLEDSLGSDSLALVPSLLGTESEMKSAIDEMKAVGSVSEATFKRIHDAAGAAGDDVEKYARAMLASEIANKKLKDAQDQLNSVTKAYDDKLGPLKAKLDALNKKDTTDQSNTQLERLRAMMAVQAPAGMGPDKAKVQAEIDKILLEQQIANTEEEKTAAVDAAQAKVDAAKEVADAAAAQLKLQQDMMAVQKEQNDLIKQQIALQEKKDAADDKSAAAQDKAAKKQEKDAEAAAKKSDAAAKKLATEQEAQEQREYKVRLAQAQTATDKLQVMQTEQEKYQAGSKEYLAIQAQIETQKKAVEKATDSAATKEEVAAKKVSDAEFEATLATKDRAGKIDMLHEKLNGMTEGSLEYEKTLGRVNALEFQQDHAKGPKAKKEKPTVGGGIFKGLDEVAAPVQNITKSFSAVTDSVGKATAAFTTFKEKLAPVFKFFTDNGQIIVFVIQKLVSSFLIALAIEKLIKPLLKVVVGFREFLTWGNALWLLLTFLGYAWKTNLGGLRDIVNGVWDNIKAPLNNLLGIFERIKAAFASGGISAAFSEVMRSLGDIGGNIANIGTIIFQGIVTWVTPFISNFHTVIDKVVEWIKNDGVSNLATGIYEGLTGMFGGSGSSNMIVAGLMGLIGGFNYVLEALVKAVILFSPKLTKQVMDVIHNMIQWLTDYTPVALESLGAILGVIAFGLLNGIGKILPEVLGIALDLAGWLLSMIPYAVSAIGNVFIAIGSWAMTDGYKLLLELIGVVFQKLGDWLPSIGLNLGRALGQLLTKTFAAIYAVGTYIRSDKFQGELTTLFQTKLIPGLISFCRGFVGFFLGFISGLFTGLADPIITGLRGVLIGVGQGMGDAINNTMKPFMDGVNEWLNWFGVQLLGWPGTILDAIFPGFKVIATQVIEGLKIGFSGSFVDLVTLVISLFDSFVAAVKNFLGIASPSTVFSDIGIFLIQGLINGILSLAGAIYDTVKKMLDTILGFFGTNFDDVVSKLVSFVLNFMKNTNDFRGKFILAIATLIVDVINKVVAFFADLLEKFGINRDSVMKVVNDFKAKIVAAYDYVLSEGKRIFTGLQTFISDVWNGIKATAAKMFSIEGDSIPGKILQGVFAAVTLIESYLTGDNGSGGLVGTFKNAWDGIGKNIRDFATSIGTDIGLVIDAAKKAATDGLNDMIRLANKAIDAINKVSDAVGLGHIGHIPEVGYALGTSSARGGMALVGENGPEIVNIPSGSSVATNSKTADMFKSQADNISRQVNASIDRAIQAFSSAVGRANKISEDRMLQAIQRASVGGVKATTTNVTTIKNTHEQHDHYNMTVNSRAEVSTVVQDYHTMKLLRRR